jgi:hypothetical protein
MYTRKDFRSVALTVSKIYPLAARNTEAEKWARKFAEENPRFNRGLFMEACGVK